MKPHCLIYSLLGWLVGGALGVSATAAAPGMPPGFKTQTIAIPR